MATSAQISVGVTATVIAALKGHYQTVYLHNLGGGAIYLGNSDVTISNGYKFDNGDKIEIILGPQDNLYGVVASGTHTVSMLQQTH